MTVKIQSVEELVKHTQDVLKTFTYPCVIVTPVFGTTHVNVLIPSNSCNPIGKLSILGVISASSGIYRIDAINLITDNENVFYHSLHKLYVLINTLQMDLDNAHKIK